jgi:hypothetical protein
MIGVIGFKSETTAIRFLQLAPTNLTTSFANENAERILSNTMLAFWRSNAKLSASDRMILALRAW